VLWILGGCIVARRTLDMPPNDETTVAVLTGTLGHPIEGIARHPWIAVRRKGATDWRVYEVGGGGTESDPFHDHSQYGDPILQGMWRGEEADRMADCVEKIAHDEKRDVEDHYIFYPGPNSNTFGDRVMRACGLHASLPSTSVGKDWRGWIGGGVTSEGTGLQLEKPDEGLPKIAAATGGGYFELTSAANLVFTFERVADELHHQYVLGFTPAVLDGKSHALTVRVSKPQFTVRARKSYLATRVRRS